MRIIYVLLICFALTGCKHQLVGEQWDMQHGLVDQGRGHVNVVSGIYEIDFDYERKNGQIRMDGVINCVEGENESSIYSMLRFNFCFTDENGVIQDVQTISYHSSGTLIACTERAFRRTFRDKSQYKGISIGLQAEEYSR